MRRLISVVLLATLVTTARAAPGAAMKAVPAEAVVVAVAAGDPLALAGSVALDADERKAFADDLRALARAQLGIDLAAVTSTAAFLLKDGAFAIALTGVKAAPAPPSQEIAVFAKDGCVVVGQPAAVAAAAAVLEHRSAGLDPAARIGRLLAGETAPIVVAVDGRVAAPAGLTLDAFGVALDARHLRFVARGSDAVLKSIVAKMDFELETVERGLAAQRSAGADLRAALLAVSGYHMLKHLRRRLRPEIAGDRLAIDVATDTMTWVWVGTMFASVAIPAFMKNAQRAKAAKAAAGSATP
jgi:hypothetical protein